MLRALIAIIFGILIYGPSHADSGRNGRALITCYPGAGYFELQSLQVYPEGMAPEQGTPVVPRVYSPAELEEEPFVCTLPGSEIIVEGRDHVTGTGPCGARHGSEVRITVNGVPVTGTFLTTPSGLVWNGEIGEGWIELSDCFQHLQSVTVLSVEGQTDVEHCYMAEGHVDTSDWLSPISGMCKHWPSNQGPFTKR